ncbi:MAG: HDIG domain-containing protein [Ignavibacterium album]|uniref:HD family phosphohydrolase n=1 Tax=Ignavibacterium album TaxID=591197 RepID=UPI0026F2B3E5|nr:HDIG domain-containing metalloprotein [Ignavibacterium album]MBI5661845.1 HDIG domain-containing protein [Ignavibacterium album]
MSNSATSVQSKGIKRKILIFLVTTVVIVFMFPKGESLDFQVSEGTIWTNEDLIAPFSFPVLKDPIVYANEVKQAEESVYPVFVRRDINIQDSLKSFNKYLIEILDENLKQESSNVINPTFFSPETFSLMLSLHREYKSTNRTRKSLTEYLGLVIPVIEKYMKRGLLNITAKEKRKDSIAVRIGNVDKIVPINEYKLLDEARQEIREEILNLRVADEIKKILNEYATYFTIPTLIYDHQATEIEIEQAKNSVPRYSGIVNENERIVAKHDRITKQVKLKIESYKEAKGDEVSQLDSALQFLGKFLHIAALLAIFGIYLYLFRKKIFFDTRKILLISFLFVFLSFITFLVNSVTIKAPIQYLIFIPVASMIFTITFDSRVGFYSTVIITLITGALRGNDYTFMATNFIAGALSVYTVRDIKNRTQIFRSFLFIMIGYLTSIFAFGLERFATLNTMLYESAFAVSNALISPALTYGLLIFFERIFRITTDLTLLELSNYERPLLRELATKAPGTFNHTLIMSLIAESAAEKIGAHTLLARVGALYHDIGKTISPHAFVENQMKGENLHENLKPEESVQILLRHVQEGIELARLNKLPQEIIDFIPMHHGTTVMTFFYEKAKELYGEENVNVEGYKYKGPKPNTKETAIVMLADGCESAVRSISEPDATKIENMVNTIINSRLREGQLDDSPLTFADIKKIKEAFLNILILQNHKRIKYPRQQEAESGIDTTDEN